KTRRRWAAGVAGPVCPAPPALRQRAQGCASPSVSSSFPSARLRQHQRKRRTAYRGCPLCGERYSGRGEIPIAAMLSAAGQHEFEAASRSPFVSELTAIFTGRQRMLLPLDEVVRAARMDGQVDRGVQELPVAQIRGSEGRIRDFDSSFHPLKQHLRERWIRLYNLIQLGREMPPISVYRVAEVYFVKDGHHRVSVARHLGWEVIRAYVVEIKTRAPLD